MHRSLIPPIHFPLLLLCSISSTIPASAGEGARKSSSGPRKVRVATVIHSFSGRHPGLNARVNEVLDLIDRVGDQTERKYGERQLDLIVLPEEAISRSGSPIAQERAIQLKGKLLERFSAKARALNSYLILPAILQEDASSEAFNSAVLIDRSGKIVGTYNKVFPVSYQGTNHLEGGISPGDSFPVFDCDFGKLGIQICFDMTYPEGWHELARNGAEIVALPTASPQTARPSSYALQGGYYVVSSTPRNNASIFNPLGRIEAQIKEEEVLLYELDLAYALVNWSPTLRDGKVLRSKYGERVGFQYYRDEDAGIFWSNDAELTVGEMIRESGQVEAAPQTTRIRKLQDTKRGGPPPGAVR